MGIKAFAFISNITWSCFVITYAISVSLCLWRGLGTTATAQQLSTMMQLSFPEHRKSQENLYIKNQRQEAPY